MNILIDRCPEVLKLNGKDFYINSDHKTSILFELLMKDPNYSDEQKLLKALNLYYSREIPEDIELAFESIVWFYSLGKSKEEINKDIKVTASKAPERDIYSFEQDAGLIYSSFLLCYKIDLNDVDIHWWKFRNLFFSLPEDSPIKKVMEIRSSKITANMSSEEKKRLNSLKKIYQLPVTVDFADVMDSMF